MKNRLVAHRGDMTQYIENTLPAIQAAIDLRMSWIEIDIQISRDGTAMVVHDDDLTRIAGRNLQVTTLSAAEVVTLPIVLKAQKESSTQIPTLDQVVGLLNAHPDITLFVEVKKESVAAFGLDKVMKSVMSALESAEFPVVVISFLYDIAAMAKSQYHYTSGWVLTEFDQQSLQQCELLGPDYIFCNVNKVKQPDDLWSGDWRWVLYDIKEPVEAKRWLHADNIMVETGDIFKLMNATELE